MTHVKHNTIAGAMLLLTACGGSSPAPTQHASAPPPVQQAKAPQVQQAKAPTVITLSGAVLFPTDGDTLSDDARATLDQVAQKLEQEPATTQIRVVGFTDTTGSAEANAALSQRRADAVRDYLAQHVKEPSRLQSMGRGEAQPIASNETASGRAINRRVEIIVKVPGSETYGMQPMKQGQTSSSAKTQSEPEK